MVDNPDDDGTDHSEESYGTVCFSEDDLDSESDTSQAHERPRTRPRSSSASSEGLEPPRTRHRYASECSIGAGDRFEREEPADEDENCTPGEEVSGEYDSASDECELDFDDDVSEDADTARFALRRFNWTHRRTFDTLEAGLRACESWGGFVYTYLTRYKTSNQMVRVYQCRSHVACEHRVKLLSRTYSFSCELFDAREHTATAFPVVRRGIHPAFRHEAESLLRMGWGAARVRVLLAEQFASQPTLLASLPSSRQLQNRKAYMMRTMPGGGEIKNFATFNAWASGRVCATREDFFSVTGEDDPAMDALIILDTFVIPSNEGETCFGVIVTSRRVFRNVATAVESQGSELSCATDGTYKLHFGGWTLVDCGTEAVTWSRGAFVHRFIPWVYMFVRSESIEAYRAMFKTIRQRARLFFGIEVPVAYASLDHSEAIASAFLSEWPQVRLLTCWPHLVRAARRKSSLLSSADVYEDMIKPHLNLLRLARTHAQFIKMSFIITTHWIASGEREYTNWFRSVYLVARWELWHVNAAGIGGVIPSQQGIEAHHAAIKKTCVPSSRAATSGVMSGILPRILLYASEALCPPKCAHFCEGPVPPEMLLKAGRLIRTTENYWKAHRGRGSRRILHSIYFNSKTHIVEASNPTATPVTKARASRFAQSLDGSVADGVTAAEIKYELLSLQRVTVGSNIPPQPFHLEPTWSEEVISLVRSFLSCSCQSFVRSGWVCSHVLATMALLQLLDVNAALTSLPVRNTPGRPRRRRPALVEGDEEDGYFRVSSLVAKFLRQPGLPLQWNIVDDFDVVDGDITEVSNFVGRVVACRMSAEDGVWIWSVKFMEDELRDYLVQDLAQAVYNAHRLRVQVVP